MVAKCILLDSCIFKATLLIINTHFVPAMCVFLLFFSFSFFFLFFLCLYESFKVMHSVFLYTGKVSVSVGLIKSNQYYLSFPHLLSFLQFSSSHCVLLLGCFMGFLFWAERTCMKWCCFSSLGGTFYVKIVYCCFIPVFSTSGVL